MVEIATCYKDRTGKVHLTLDAALEADENEALSDIIYETGVGRGGDWSSECIIKAIIGVKEELRAVLSGRDERREKAGTLYSGDRIVVGV